MKQIILSVGNSVVDTKILLHFLPVIAKEVKKIKKYFKRRIAKHENYKDKLP